MNSAGENRVVYLGFGSNMGDRSRTLRSGVSELEGLGVRPLALSSLYESPAKYLIDQPAFLNCVGRFETTLAPEDLLDACKEVERRMGRMERERFGPRELDIDILLYGGECLSVDELSIPHPAMGERLFVLMPLAQIAPDLEIPGRGSVADLLKRAERILPQQEYVTKMGELPPDRGDAT
ncbi:2-amino-4-hydroxy-6-hydroxymethyldihydropteridine diphosphokinase [Gemmatimonadota bacterium]